MSKEEIEIYMQAIEKWGADLQSLVAIEEMSELTKEIVKGFRNGGISSDAVKEIADVSIMLDQLLIVCGDTEKKLFNEHKTYKLERLKFRLNN